MNNSLQFLINSSTLLDMITIDQIITNHKIDKNKENFPVNTIRLFYLILIYTLIEDNPQEKANKMIEAIPIIGGILEKRTNLRLSGETPDLDKEWEIIKDDLNKLETIENSSSHRQTFTYLFSNFLPSQETLLFNIVRQAQNPGHLFSPTDVISTLNLRAMDSIAYSSFVSSLINKPKHNLAIHYLVNLVYQVNDLLDSILFAKEDTDNKNFSPFEIIRKSVKDSTEAKVVIKSILDKLMENRTQVTLPPETKQLTDQFLTMLVSILGEIKTESTNTEKNSEDIKTDDVTPSE